jgi:hypothetical protein
MYRIGCTHTQGGEEAKAGRGEGRQRWKENGKLNDIEKERKA